MTSGFTFTQRMRPDLCAKADAAIELDESIACGPGDRACEETRCPAHGGDSDDETDDEREARQRYEAAFAQIVGGAQ